LQQKPQQPQQPHLSLLVVHHQNKVAEVFPYMCHLPQLLILLLRVVDNLRQSKPPLLMLPQHRRAGTFLVHHKITLTNFGQAI